MLGLGAALTAAPLLFQKDDSEDEYARIFKTEQEEVQA